MYEIIGVQYYEKEGELHTIFHYLKPVNAKNGQGYSGEKLFLKGNYDAKPGDQFKPIFDIGFNNRPYIKSVEINSK